MGPDTPSLRNILLDMQRTSAAKLAGEAARMEDVQSEAEQLAASLEETQRRHDELLAEQRRMREEVERLQRLQSMAARDLEAAEKAREEAKEAIRKSSANIKGDLESGRLMEELEAAGLQPRGEEGGESSEEEGEDEEAMHEAVLDVRRAQPGEKLGVLFSNGTSEMTMVFDGLAASRAGAKAGMVVKEIDGHTVHTLVDIDTRLRECGDRFTLKVLSPFPVELPERVEVDEGAGPAPVPPPEAKEAEATEKAGTGDGCAQREEETPLRDFEASRVFLGRRKGWYFATEESGTGYYRDPRAPPHDDECGEKDKSDNEVPLPPSDLPVPSIEEFRQFCLEYAKKHPEMVLDEPPEDESEVLQRMREERRMREILENPEATRELLLKVIRETDDAKKGEVKPVQAYADPSLVEGDAWKEDYESRTAMYERQKEEWAEGKSASWRHSNREDDFGSDTEVTEDFVRKRRDLENKAEGSKRIGTGSTGAKEVRGEKGGKPTEAKPTEEKPTEEKPTEEKPTEEKPTEEKPTEEKPTEEKPTEAKPTEGKPTGMAQDETPPSQRIAARQAAVAKVVNKDTEVRREEVVSSGAREDRVNTGKSQASKRSTPRPANPRAHPRVEELSDSEEEGGEAARDPMAPSPDLWHTPLWGSGGTVPDRKEAKGDAADPPKDRKEEEADWVVLPEGGQGSTPADSDSEEVTIPIKRRTGTDKRQAKPVETRSNDDSLDDQDMAFLRELDADRWGK